MDFKVNLIILSIICVQIKCSQSNDIAVNSRSAFEEGTELNSPSKDETLSMQNDEGNSERVNFEAMCYFKSFEYERFKPSNIDPSICTHILYDHAMLSSKKLTMEISMWWIDINREFYEQVTNLKKGRDIKVSIVLGGSMDALDDRYSRLVRDAKARTNFVKQTVEFIEEHKFDGLVFNWYPVCWLRDCSRGYWKENEYFVQLMAELYRAFKTRDWSLSIIIPNEEKVVDLGYDIPNLSKYVDWMIIRTDSYGSDNRTTHIAPLFAQPGMENKNANFTVNYLIQKGAPPHKLIMTIPTYGAAYKLLNPNDVGLNAPSIAGQRFLKFNEVCRILGGSNNWTVINDRNGAYAYQSNRWFSYQDAEHIRQKSNYIREMNLGGGLLTTLNDEDFRGECCHQYTLLKTMNEVLRNTRQKKTKNCINGETEHPSRSKKQMKWGDKTDSSEIIDGETTKQKQFKVVCYFESRGYTYRIYGPSDEQFKPTLVDPSLCTHIQYGYALLDPVTLSIIVRDLETDLTGANLYKEVTAFRESHGIPVSIVLGGFRDSFSDKYSRLVHNATTRSQFIKGTIEFIEKYNFNGLEIDWRYPTCWQGVCKRGNPADKQNFMDLIKELSKEFKPRNWLLSTTVAQYSHIIDQGYDIPELSKYVDWMSVKMFLFESVFRRDTDYTTHQAPLFAPPHNPMDQKNVNFTVNYLIDQGAPPEKIVLLTPSETQTFALRDPSNQFGLNAPVKGFGAEGKNSHNKGRLYFYEVCLELNGLYNRNWTVVYDPHGTMGPYAYRDDQWLSFDDIEDVERKANYIREMGLAGMGLHPMDFDDFHGLCCGKYPLLRTINEVLRSHKKHKIRSCIKRHSNSTEMSSTQMTAKSRTDSTKETAIDSNENEFRVICYFDDRSWRRPSEGSFTAENIDTSLCTHIVYDRVVLDVNYLTIHDDGQTYENITIYRKSHGAKVILMIGVWIGKTDDRFNRLVRDAAFRERFIEDTVNYLERHSFDGLHFDWQFPVCWKNDCNKGSPDEREFYAVLIRELSEAFKPRGWLLTVGVATKKSVIEKGFDIAELSKYVDWMIVEASVPLRYTPRWFQPDDLMDDETVKSAVNYLIEKGAPSHKIVVTIYADSPTQTLAPEVNGTAMKPGAAGEYTNNGGWLSFYEVCLELNGFYHRNWTITRKPYANYANHGDQWLTYMDLEDVRRRANYIREMHLGGISLIYLDGDDFNGLCCGKYPMLRTINEVLRNNGLPDEKNCVATEEEEKKSFRVDLNKFVEYTNW